MTYVGLQRIYFYIFLFQVDVNYGLPRGAVLINSAPINVKQSRRFFKLLDMEPPFSHGSCHGQQSKYHLEPQCPLGLHI